MNHEAKQGKGTLKLMFQYTMAGGGYGGERAEGKGRQTLKDKK